MPNYKKHQNINFCPNQHPLPHRQDKTSLCPHISTQWDIISQSEVRICFGPLTTRGPSERCHQIFDSLLDFALTKQSVVRMLMSSSVSPSSHSSTSVVLVIGDLSKKISKVACKLVLWQNVKKNCAFYWTHLRLSTLLPIEWWALNIEDFMSQPTWLKCVCCNFFVKQYAMHLRITISFSNTNLFRKSR